MFRDENTMATALNPLIGSTSRETLENLCICLHKLGGTLATNYDDPSISFFARSCAAALEYESHRLALEIRQIGPR